MTTKKKPTKASGAAVEVVATDGAADVPLKDEVTLGLVEGSEASTVRRDTEPPRVRRRPFGLSHAAISPPYGLHRHR